jgi:tRNA(Leu) C34 or U34 (ribose-2'-O)-methylase TrmL
MKNNFVTIGLENPKSPSNVDVVLRAAGCYQADSIFYTGRRYERAAQYNSDKHDSRETVSLLKVDDLLKAKPKASKLVCVDLIIGATPLPKFQHPDNAYYIFGPEDGTLDQEIINLADEVIYIPTFKCMNLAATVNVVLYDRMAKGDLSHAGPKLIRSVRNTNNRTTIRGSDPI